MDSFQGYEKMPDNIRKLMSDESLSRKFSKMKWVVTEKVHGANFSFVFEEGEIRYAKRKDFLTWEDDFFGFQAMVRANEAKVTQFFSLLQDDFVFDRATIYGELFGGEYPHADVKRDDRVQAIQTGVYYSATIEFFAFDLAIEVDGERSYLDYEDAVRYFEKAGLLYAKPLRTGSLNEALSFATEFTTTIPAELGMPPLSHRNIAEGIVIKPLRHREILSPLEERPIFKIKNKEFLEDDRFHEAQKWSFKNEGDELSIELILPEVLKFVNRNRLNAVISKTGRPTNENKPLIQEITTSMVEDVLEGFHNAYGSLLADFQVQEIARLKDKVALKVQQLLSAYLSE